MNEQLTNRYRKIRAEYNGISARSALSWARASLKPSPWTWSNDSKATADIDGFDLTLSVTPDDWPDTSWLGTFTDTWSPDVVNVPGDGWRYAPAAFRIDYRYFEPGVSIEEHRRALRDLGCSKHNAYTMARGYVLKDMSRAREIQLYDVTVTASRNGIELGSASVGSCDLGTDLAGCDFEVQTETIADDLVNEAIEEAQTALEGLRA